MMRLALLATLFGTLVGLPLCADDPPKKLTPEERKELEARWKELDTAGGKHYQAGKYAEAASAAEESLVVAKRLYPKAEFPDGHKNLAASLNNVAFMRQNLGRLTEAEPLFRDALDIWQRLYPGDHPDVAQGLNNLGGLLRAQGKLTEAEPLFRDALEMRQRIHNGDHPLVAISMNNLALLFRSQGKLTEAEALFREALDMTRRHFKGDHPNVLLGLNNMGFILQAQRQLAEAEPYYRDALDMSKRLYKGDHPSVANSLNNVAGLLELEGKFAEAEPLYRDALDMWKRLFKGDHPNLVLGLNNLAKILNSQGKTDEAERLSREALEMVRKLYKGDHHAVIQGLSHLAGMLDAQEKFAESVPLHREALMMSRRLLEDYAKHRTEGDTLTLLASLPLHRDAFLSVALKGKATAATVYSEVWSSKATVARVYEQRQQAARSATNPHMARLLAELAEARRRRAELLLAPDRDATTREKRQDDLKALDTTIRELEDRIRPLLPVVERGEKLAKATPADLQTVLSPEVAIVDFLRYSSFEWARNKSGNLVQMSTLRYLAVVVTNKKLVVVELANGDEIEDAIVVWRNAITSGKNIPAAVPAKVRELVWEKVRKELPANIKTVYLSPDFALCRVPWGTLPGDKPGTILLEDFAIATIPHAPFLLDKLWPQDPLKNPPTGALVVGGVNFDAEATAGPVNRNLPVKPGAKIAWQALPGAATEATGVANVAARKKLTVTSLKGENATPATVLATLPQAKYAHFATHGFFADPSFRSAFQLDEKDFQRSLRGERIGRAALSPLVMTGLVFAGANNPKTPGSGIVTGEALVDLDLSGLELAVLSACETGLGEVADGEGTFGLQRAFHLAGTRDVVASLWKVPDTATAALMAEFYRNLWELNLTPMEALRQAQLTIYRNPGKIGELAAGFRAGFKEVEGTEVAIKPAADGKTPTRMWAAFTLSGPGR